MLMEYLYTTTFLFAWFAVPAAFGIAVMYAADLETRLKVKKSN